MGWRVDDFLPWLHGLVTSAVEKPLLTRSLVERASLMSLSLSLFPPAASYFTFGKVNSKPWLDWDSSKFVSSSNGYLQFRWKTSNSEYKISERYYLFRAATTLPTTSRFNFTFKFLLLSCTHHGISENRMLLRFVSPPGTKEYRETTAFLFAILFHQDPPVSLKSVSSTKTVPPVKYEAINFFIVVINEPLLWSYLSQFASITP